MIILNAIRCEFIGCMNHPSFNFSIEHRAKYCSKGCHIVGSVGRRGYWFGKSRPLEKMGNAIKTMFRTEKVIGSNNPNWKGGVTEKNWSLRHTSKYLKFRREVLERDGYKCVVCESTAELTVDHIIPFSVSIEKRLDPTNGRVICRPCHIKSPTWGGRVKNFATKEVVSYA